MNTLNEDVLKLLPAVAHSFLRVAAAQIIASVPATANENFPLLIVSTIVVVGANKILWKRLYSLSEERFKIEL